MKAPICCGKRATSYLKDYGFGGFEAGFRCKKCGAIRIPFLPAFGPPEDYESIRLAGIVFDESLCREVVLV